MQGLFGGVGDHGLLAVQLLLGEVVHHLPHAGLASHAHTTESFALSIGSVLIKLDLQEVRDSQVLNIVLDVLIVNQTRDTLQACTLELATLGDLKLVEKPQV